MADAVLTADDLVKLYTDTIITHDVNEIPYKLLTIDVMQFERVEAVAAQIAALNDINNLTGTNLDLFGEKWFVDRNGDTDNDYRENIIDRMGVYFSGSTLHDFLNALIFFDAPVGSTVTENLPPERAQVNILLNGASVDLAARITAVLNTIRAAGVEIDVITASTGGKLLKEDGDHLSLESGDFILLE